MSLEWFQGKITLLIGPSGSGKSTLARLMKGLLITESGRIEFVDNDSVTQLKPDGLIDLVGWADAQPERQIFAASVAEEVAFAALNRGIRGIRLLELVNKALRNVGLPPDQFLDRDPLSLSGGEKRRVSLASTIITDSPFVILDEPEAGLDDTGIETVVGLAGKLKSDGAGVMVITHDPATIWKKADRVVALAGGRVIGDFHDEAIDWAKLTGWLQGECNLV